ncbi:MAG: hypothetical protein H2172_09795 [Opitutus sp.]|nr:hypothetical protein [Opitutus sp.]MCS6247301.1 hypothetical protein [Opitutus sp.]MCS6273485.1 hypothetical protein [Opitutus sp.]MCS6276644.1 hypothetical protein [Opitutus sp.]MCS6301707.1 hypothetical protein [Opitutus sp.]
MAKPKPTHPIAWFLVRRLAGLKRGAERLCPVLWLRLILTLFGILGQLAPWLAIRTLTLWIPAPGDFSPALNRLLWGLPVYGFWCGFSTYWVRDYCQLWVAVVWAGLLLFGGMLALGQTQLRQRLRVRYPLPGAVTQGLGAASLLVVASCAAALIYVSPIEFFRGNAPDFSRFTPAQLEEKLTDDEQKLAVVLAELASFNTEEVAAPSTPTASASWTESTSAAAAASASLAPLQRQARVLRYHTTLRRLAWGHQNHTRLGDETSRLRAQTLQLTAAAAASNLANRWNLRLDDAARAELFTPLAPREPKHGKALITPEWVEKVRPFLQPGDILLTKANGYRATGHLPGAWSQLSLYVGTTGQLEQSALDQDMRVQRHLEKLATPEASGHHAAVISVEGNGVGLTSLERTIGEADSVAVLRPKLRPVQRLEMVARAFDQVGKPYDYDFDFAHADKVLCSELVARALEGFVDFPLHSVGGQPVLTGDGLVEYWAEGEGGPKLEFVAYVIGDEATAECNWASPGDLAVGRRTVGNGELQLIYDAPLKP